IGNGTWLNQRTTANLLFDAYASNRYRPCLGVATVLQGRLAQPSRRSDQDGSMVASDVDGLQWVFPEGILLCLGGHAWMLCWASSVSPNVAAPLEAAGQKSIYHWLRACL